MEEELIDPCTGEPVRWRGEDTPRLLAEHGVKVRELFDGIASLPPFSSGQVGDDWTPAPTYCGRIRVPDGPYNTNEIALLRLDPPDYELVEHRSLKHVREMRDRLGREGKLERAEALARLGGGPLVQDELSILMSGLRRRPVH